MGGVLQAGLSSGMLPMIRGLILDYGGVLSLPQRSEWLQAMAQQVGATTEAFRAAYWHHRQLYDSGLPATEYWRLVLSSLGLSNPSAAVSSLIELDVASWTEYREEVWHLARSFRDRGGHTAFLSNGVPEVMTRIRADRSLEAWFDAVVVSCEVGVSKPNPAIYWLCLSRLGLQAGQTLFVDDRVENIEAAARLGIQTLHFSADDAVSRLVQSIRALED